MTRRVIAPMIYRTPMVGAAGGKTMNDEPTVLERLTSGEGRTVGLALGGGAARGWAHIGVLQALTEAGVRPCCVAGTSMGALVGASFAAGRIDKLAEAALAMDRRTLLSFLDRAFSRAGLQAGERLKRVLRDYIPVGDIAAMPVPFRAVATDLGTGMEVVLDQGDPVDAVRASISVPGLYTPVSRGGRFLVDGGLVNPIPVNVARAMGAELIVAVDVNHDTLRARPYLSRDQAEPADVPPQERQEDLAILERLTANIRVPSWASLVSQEKHAEGKLPSLLETVVSSLAVSAVAIGELRLAADRPDVLVQPRVGHVRFLDLHRAEEAIEAGYEATWEVLESRAQGALGYRSPTRAAF